MYQAFLAVYHLVLQMSQKDSENDIWDYKPLQKKKKTEGALSSVAKKRRSSKKTAPKKDTPLSVRSGKPGKAAATGDFCGNINKEEHGTSEAQTLPSQPVSPDPAAEGSSCGGFCPICQMPFSILVVQSQRWHVAECLDTPRDANKGTYIHAFFISKPTHDLQTSIVSLVGAVFQF